MKVTVLASGSKGNCTYIETPESKILIDLGTSSLYVEKALKELNVDPHQINAIILTHTHVDHVSGLRVFMKKYHTPIYLTPIMLKELEQSIVIPEYRYIESEMLIDDIHIQPIKTSHDTEDAQGYIIENGCHSLAYITDTGYLNVKNHPLLENKEMYIIESNHDVNMLMEGRYPFHIKQRILGDRGHLSNEQCAYYLSKFIGEKTKNIVLIHLSQDNNTEELALTTLQMMLQERDIHLDRLLISDQKERTEVVEL